MTQTEMIGLEEVATKPRLIKSDEIPPPAQENKPEKDVNHMLGMFMTTFQTIAMMLAVRLFLLLSVVGAFILSYFALYEPSPHSLWVLGIFCAFTVPPLVYLDIKTRTK